MTNTTGTTMTGVKFLEMVDPDNDVDLPGGEFETSHWINKQPGFDGNPDQAQIYARGTIYPNVIIGLGATDSRARVGYGDW